ncbi:hypothetical protein PILCRDRAFT_827320 [Piloderma croceum F 1598]|uniref:Uncharacterized protein n=1 Tax=Piloderma croceum (strain F 1598) TaxID=765440 RepID=A0A0C3ES47_PILCF|nr:hypothetical protein PILCRDRAFT_827320 [Piloderma croceum F 1598]
MFHRPWAEQQSGSNYKVIISKRNITILTYGREVHPSGQQRARTDYWKALISMVFENNRTIQMSVLAWMLINTRP